MSSTSAVPPRSTAPQPTVPGQATPFPASAVRGSPPVAAPQTRRSGADRAVPLLRWPEQAAEVERCRTHGIPRLLLVEPAASPPVCVDPLEDWVRAPVGERDLQARRAALRARAECRKPVIDVHNVLRYAGRALPLAAGEADLVRLLLDNYRSVVGRAELAVRMWPEGDAERRNALDVRVLRARRRLAPLGLVIKTVWRTGYMLDTRRDGEAV
ncbi:winged helix-turn-helix domain-containing protein [Streptomyces halobius]|uniref:Winged helix-turn-helix domain-containing protein n=1 Tax=Streptomyces halobius TaxID=2879846 RepID=A0ABY4ML36_9ACTN|nr:winged helix-turn-helix domain-containing protein [Streptomyces halobius]UQA97409.1 winged helix-turn-helix domain-containing protein [Streptomyces halobius]